MNIRRFMQLVTPPLLARLPAHLRSIIDKTSRNKLRTEWEYIPQGWAYARTHPEVMGWNVRDVLETYKEKWPRFVAMTQGTAPLGVAHESALASNHDIISHNIIASFGYAVALASHCLDSLSILDWGGGIGHYYLLARSLLPGIRIDYHCKDVPMLADYGAQLFPEQHFYTDDSCLKGKYDLVMASTSMHYTEDWRRLLAGLAAASRRYLYITSLPVVLHAPSFVFIQRPYAYGYNTEYLAWCLNRHEFLKCAAEANMRLIREFVVGHRPLIHGAPEENQYRGFLFVSAQPESMLRERQEMG